MTNIQVTKGQNVTKNTILGYISNVGVPDKNNHLHVIVYTGDNSKEKLKSFNTQITPKNVPATVEENIQEASTANSPPTNQPISLILYIHDGDVNGPTIQGAQVTGRDGSGNSFQQTTDSNGYVTIWGDSGTWSFTTSVDGYVTNSWDQDITKTDTKDAFLTKHATEAQSTTQHVSYGSETSSDSELGDLINALRDKDTEFG